MTDVMNFPNGTDTNLQQVIAREAYLRLREKMVALQSAPEPDAAAIDAVIRSLEKAQLAYKATHGLIGNNPVDDLPSGAV